MAFKTNSQALSPLHSRGFAEEAQDEVSASTLQFHGRQPDIHKNYWNIWQELLEQLPTEKREQPDVVDLVNQLNGIEPEIEDKTRTAEKLWELQRASDVESIPNDVDLDALLKKYQLRVDAGDQLSQDDLMCLDRLYHLNKTKNAKILGLSKCFDRDRLGVYHRIDLLNGLGNSNSSRFHVVIVGINKYDDPRTPSLHGCVNDALLFRDYLMQELLVPFDRITVLLSPTGAEHIPCSYEIPTRDKILNALYGLYDNPDIKPDDSIIFFYAGHGQSYPAAQSSFVCTPKSTGSIEAVCPVDRNTPKSRTTIVDISDREINVILGEIAKKRCENITVILDCCYAGGGTRSTSSSFDSLQLGEKGCFTARTCPAIPNAIELMLKAADASGRLPSDRPHTAVPNFRANMKSHVLIASAKDYEEALEYKDMVTGVRQGYFTTRFVSALRSSTPTTTYRDVIGSTCLVMPFQTAYVAGRKTARLWFA